MILSLKLIRAKVAQYFDFTKQICHKNAFFKIIKKIKIIRMLKKEADQLMSMISWSANQLIRGSSYLLIRSSKHIVTHSLSPSMSSTADLFFLFLTKPLWKSIQVISTDIQTHTQTNILINLHAKSGVYNSKNVWVIA